MQPEKIVYTVIKAESKEITGEFSFSSLCFSKFLEVLVLQYELFLYISVWAKLHCRQEIVNITTL